MSIDAAVAGAILRSRSRRLRVSPSVASRARRCRRQLQHLADVAGRSPAPRGTPVIADAARLKVRTRPSASAVTRPLSRLSMTYSLNARRSAISCEASSSRAPAERRLSASDPASSATAKKPNRLIATVYCAKRSVGSSTTGVTPASAGQQLDVDVLRRARAPDTARR